MRAKSINAQNAVMMVTQKKMWNLVNYVDNMKYHTETIPVTLAEKLKEKGYWNPGCTITSQYNNACYYKDGRLYNDGVVADWDDLIPAPTYAEVFDWFLEREIIICIGVDDCKKDGKWTYDYDYYIGRIIPPNKLVQADFVQLLETWHEAANAAIEKALELI